ncbi:hypothetical protein DENSPDRAFT_885916 [Dentipellis sp. KUC8613]|nr:hypothetical protein DENSPDRAFT_885916 [Dentipellis sp. KUC8613]
MLTDHASPVSRACVLLFVCPRPPCRPLCTLYAPLCAVRALDSPSAPSTRRPHPRLAVCALDLPSTPSAALCRPLPSSLPLSAPSLPLYAPYAPSAPSTRHRLAVRALSAPSSPCSTPLRPSPPLYPPYALSTRPLRPLRRLLAPSTWRTRLRTVDAPHAVPLPPYCAPARLTTVLTHAPPPPRAPARSSVPHRRPLVRQRVPPPSPPSPTHHRPLTPHRCLLVPPCHLCASAASTRRPPPARAVPTLSAPSAAISTALLAPPAAVSAAVLAPPAAVSAALMRRTYTPSTRPLPSPPSSRPLPPCRPAALPPCRPAALPPCRPATLYAPYAPPPLRRHRPPLSQRLATSRLSCTPSLPLFAPHCTAVPPLVPPLCTVSRPPPPSRIRHGPCMPHRCPRHPLAPSDTLLYLGPPSFAPHRHPRRPLAPCQRHTRRRAVIPPIAASFAFATMPHTLTLPPRAVTTCPGPPFTPPLPAVTRSLAPPSHAVASPAPPSFAFAMMPRALVPLPHAAATRTGHLPSHAPIAHPLVKRRPAHPSDTLWRPTDAAARPSDNTLCLSDAAVGPTNAFLRRSKGAISWPAALCHTRTLWRYRHGPLCGSHAPPPTAVALPLVAITSPSSVVSWLVPARGPRTPSPPRLVACRSVSCAAAHVVPCGVVWAAGPAFFAPRSTFCTPRGAALLSSYLRHPLDLAPRHRLRRRPASNRPAASSLRRVPPSSCPASCHLASSRTAVPPLVPPLCTVISPPFTLSSRHPSRRLAPLRAVLHPFAPLPIPFAPSPTALVALPSRPSSRDCPAPQRRLALRLRRRPRPRRAPRGVAVSPSCTSHPVSRPFALFVSSGRLAPSPRPPRCVASVHRHALVPVRPRAIALSCPWHPLPAVAPLLPSHLALVSACPPSRPSVSPSCPSRRRLCRRPLVSASPPPRATFAPLVPPLPSRAVATPVGPPHTLHLRARRAVTPSSCPYVPSSRPSPRRPAHPSDTLWRPTDAAARPSDNTLCLSDAAVGPTNAFLRRSKGAISWPAALCHTRTLWRYRHGPLCGSHAPPPTAVALPLVAITSPSSVVSWLVPARGPRTPSPPRLVACRSVSCAAAHVVPCGVLPAAPSRSRPAASTCGLTHRLAPHGAVSHIVAPPSRIKSPCRVVFAARPALFVPRFVPSRVVSHRCPAPCPAPLHCYLAALHAVVAPPFAPSRTPSRRLAPLRAVSHPFAPSRTPSHLFPSPSHHLPPPSSRCRPAPCPAASPLLSAPSRTAVALPPPRPRCALIAPLIASPSRPSSRDCPAPQRRLALRLRRRRRPRRAPRGVAVSPSCTSHPVSRPFALFASSGRLAPSPRPPRCVASAHRRALVPVRPRAIALSCPWRPLPAVAPLLPSHLALVSACPPSRPSVSPSCPWRRRLCRRPLVSASPPPRATFAPLVPPSPSRAVATPVGPPRTLHLRARRAVTPSSCPYVPSSRPSPVMAFAPTRPFPPSRRRRRLGRRSPRRPYTPSLRLSRHRTCLAPSRPHAFVMPSHSSHRTCPRVAPLVASCSVAQSSRWSHGSRARPPRILVVTLSCCRVIPAPSLHRHAHFTRLARAVVAPVSPLHLSVVPPSSAHYASLVPLHCPCTIVPACPWCAFSCFSLHTCGLA